MERSNIVRSKGDPVTLLGAEIAVGDKAPDFRMVDSSLRPVTLKDSSGRVRLFSVIPSIDTGICAIQTKTFNTRAQQVSDKVKLFAVSVDLPYAQSRFVEAKRIDKMTMLSDYQDRSFGMNYGTLIKETKLLARSVFIVDETDTVRYIQYVPEMSNEPDYDAALNALRKIISEQ